MGAWAGPSFRTGPPVAPAPGPRARAWMRVIRRPRQTPSPTCRSRHSECGGLGGQLTRRNFC
eukprot:13176864-Alexandrium_andersonii.AAC.1